MYGSIFLKKITVTAFSSLAIIGFLFFAHRLYMKAPKVHTQTLHVRDVYEIVSCQERWTLEIRKVFPLARLPRCLKSAFPKAIGLPKGNC